MWEAWAELCETRVRSAPSFPALLVTLGSVCQSAPHRVGVGGPGKKGLEDLKPGRMEAGRVEGRGRSPAAVSSI